MPQPSPIGERSDRVFRNKIAGPPLSGSWKQGDIVIDAIGATHTCAISGAPGSWNSSFLVVDEVVDLTGNAALFKAMATAIPAGAIIEEVVQAITVLVVGGGTTVKTGIGLNGSDPDAYGLAGALTKNTKKAGRVEPPAPLAAATTLEVCGCTTAGALGDTNLTAGKVRVRVTYRPAPVGLPDVA
jgi:hypothetical protein